MARTYFENLPSTNTPLRAERFNGLLNGEESIEKIVVGSIEGKNLFDKDNNINYYNWLIYQNGEIGYSNISPIRLIQIPIVGGRTYTISKVAGTRFRASTSDKDVSQFSKTTNNGVNSHITNDTGATITITSTASDKYLYFTIADSETDYNTMKQSTMVEEGSTATDYVPYMKYGYNEDTNMGKLIVEKISGKNLYDGNYTKEVIQNDGTIVANGSFALSGFIEVDSNKPYTFSVYNGAQQSLNIVEYTSNKTFIKRNSQGLLQTLTPYTITTSSTTKYVRINYSTYYGANIAQLEKGNIGTPYQDFNTTQMGNIVVDGIEGKNLYNATMVSSATNAVTYKADTNKLYMNGTPSSDGRIQFGKSIYLKRGTYTFSMTLSSGTINRNTTFYLYSGTNSTEISWTVVSSLTVTPTINNVATVTFNVANGGYIFLANYLYTNQTFTNAEFNYIIEKGDKFTGFISYDTYANSKREEYSTGEEKIGRWIDGKILYRKVIIGTCASAINTTLTLGNISNLKDVAEINAIWKANDNYRYFMSNPSESPVVYINASGDVNENHKGTYFNSVSIIVTIKYTKTTD